MTVLPSTGAFIGRVNGRDHRAFLRVSDRLDSSAFEFMMYEAFYDRLPETLADFLASGLAFPSLHAEKRIGELIGLGGEENRRESEHRFLTNCRAAERLGAERLVLHLWNGTPSDFAFPRHLEAYATFSELAREHGLTLTVENVVCAAADPLTHFLALADRYPEVTFTYDTKMAAFHRQETAPFCPPYSTLVLPRIKHIHFNDYGGVPGDFSRLSVLHLGEGYLDLEGIAARFVAGGYDGTVTLECSCMCPDGSLVPEKMNASLRTARRLFAGRTAE